MKLTGRLFLVLVAALALASAASAKEVTNAQACGSGDDCAPLGDQRSVMLILNSGGKITNPPRLGSYYRLDFVFGVRGSPDYDAFADLYVSSKGLVGSADEFGHVIWWRVPSPGRAVIEHAITKLQPFSAPAAWPTSTDEPILTPKPMSVSAGRMKWTPWLFAAVVLLLALGVGGVFARRLHVRRLSTA
jgi:hypothetical protein